MRLIGSCPLSDDWVERHAALFAACLRHSCDGYDGQKGVGLDFQEVKTEGQVSLTAKGRSLQSGVMRNVHVPENRGLYRLSFSYRMSADDVQAFCGGMFYGVKELRGMSFPLPASREWKRFETIITLNYPAEAQTDFTLLLLLSNGKTDSSQVWFDDVHLELLSPAGVG